MDLSTAIKSRRSIRKYDATRTVDRDTVMRLIEAAQLAPSWKNSQTGRYYAAVSDEMKSKVYDLLPEFNRNNSRGAAYIVTTFVSGRSGFGPDGAQTNELGNGWGCYDLGLQTQNLLLKATELGLGTLIMGTRDEKGLRSLLGIPDSETVVAVIAVGWPDIEPNMPARNLPDEIVKIF